MVAKFFQKVIFASFEDLLLDFVPFTFISNVRLVNNIQCNVLYINNISKQQSEELLCANVLEM